MKFSLQLDFHMKIILTSRIDDMNFLKMEKKFIAHEPSMLRIAAYD
jgi:hypothetical protein